MSKKAEFKELLEAGVHFGHLKRKWNPAMAPYIFDEQKGIHVIDLNKTISHLDQACAAIKQIAKSGRKILFVATKRQATQVLQERVKETGMPYITERWAGGMLTNFATTRKSIRKMTAIDKMKTNGVWETLNKRERLFKTRQRDKLDKNFGSIANMTRQPSAIFIVDILKEEIALKESNRLGITTFAMVDTNTNPKAVDFPIPANDDATKSVDTILKYIVEAINEGLAERKTEKASREEEKKAEKENAEKAKEAKVSEKKEAKTDEKAVEDKAEKVDAPKKKTPVKKAVAKVEKAEAPKKKAPAKKTAAKIEKKEATPKKTAAKSAKKTEEKVEENQEK